MKIFSEVLLPDIGQTIIIRENFGKKKKREVKCTVEEIYKTFILVARLDNKTRESFMKADFFTGYIDYRNCI